MQKSISILMVALLATGMSLTAQNRGNGAPQGAGSTMGKPGMGRMKELNLTEDQKAKLQVMHQGFAVQDSVSKVQYKKQRESVRAERQLALAKILTPEQMLQMDKIRVEKGQKAAKKGQFGRGNGKQGFRQGGFASQGRGQMMGQRGQMGQGRGKMMGQRGQMGQGRGQMLGQRGQMTQMRGQMMNKRAQILGNRGQMNRGGMQMRNGQAPFSKKDAKGFQNQAKRMNKAPMVNPEVRIKNQVDRMTKQLDLTPEQASKIQDIQTKHFKKDIAKFHKFEKKRDAQFKKNHGNIDEIKAVLTPEQTKKMDALKEKAPRMEMKNGPMNGPMNGRS